MTIVYQPIAMIDKNEIFDALEHNNDDNAVIESVLAAIYHHETEFAAVVLLKALRAATGARWLYLARLIETFMQGRRTSCQSCAFLAELRKTGIPEDQRPEVLELIDAVNEFRDMFRDR